MRLMRFILWAVGILPLLAFCVWWLMRYLAEDDVTRDSQGWPVPPR